MTVTGSSGGASESSSPKDQIKRLKERILAQSGTVLDSVQGEVVLDDADSRGKPRLGPVLVLRSIEEGSILRLAHPRPVTVLGSLSGQVFGAYRVKAGNLLSGRIEGARHVEIVHNLGSKGTTNVDSWIVFEATSDPGFFAQAQQGLEKLRELERHQQPQREDTARQLLLHSLKDVSYDIKVSVPVGRLQKTVFAIRPTRHGREVELDLKALLRHLIPKAEQLETLDKTARVDRFKMVLTETIAESLHLANSGGIGAALRRKRGQDAYQAQVEEIYNYLFPKLMQLWLKVSENFMQCLVDRLSEVPMILKVDGQLVPFFQIEYPRWKFRVIGSKIVPEKIADCNIACQAGRAPGTMSLTYTYVGGEDWITQTRELKLEETRCCLLILKNGHVYLTEETNCLFGPTLEKQ